MDATMVAMRSASEQQLPDCLSPADACSPGGTNSPSVATLMTLLWAIHVIEREREQKLMTPELDAATEVREAVRELEDMFRQREVNGKGVVSFMASQSITPSREIAGWTRESQKSLDGWRTAFNKHD
jgi:transcriptional activator HAC1